MQTTLSSDVESVLSDQPTIVTSSSGVGEWVRLRENGHEHVDIERVAGIPVQLLSDYAEAAVRHARVIQIEPGLWFAEIVGFQGIWGEGSSADMALADLLAAFPKWVELKLIAGAEVPSVGGFDLNLPLTG